MSDSEYESYSEDVAPIVVPAPPPPSLSSSQSSRKKKAPVPGLTASPAAAASDPKTRKRKLHTASVLSAAALGEATSSSRSKKNKDIFSIIHKEERASTSKVLGDRGIASSFTSRVSSGQCRRTATTTGEFFVDLKIYNSEDVKNTPIEERFKKALASVKIQCDEKSGEWEVLQLFIGKAYAHFAESEPVYFGNKTTLK